MKPYRFKFWKVLIVTGSRAWPMSAQHVVASKLRDFFIHDDSRYRNQVLIHGWCPDPVGDIHHASVDEIADKWVRALGTVRIICIPFFTHLGKAGGPARNRVLAQIGQSFKTGGALVQVYGFPMEPVPKRGSGTWGCLEICRRAGLPRKAWGPTNEVLDTNYVLLDGEWGVPPNWKGPKP